MLSFIKPKYIITYSGVKGGIIKNQAYDTPQQGYYPAYSASGQDVWLPEYHCDQTGIVLSAVGARCGKTFLATGKYGLCANTHLLILDTTKCYPLFVQYVLNNEDWWLKGGSAQPFVKVMESLNQKISLPPIEAQKTIASFLDKKCSEIDALSTDIQSQIEILEEYKKSVITEAVTKGLNPDVEMKDSGIEWIGMIPKHWKCVRLKHCLDKKTTNMRVGPFGSALSGSDIQDSGVWVYNQRCVLDKNFTTNDTFISEEKFRELKSFEVFEGDILITTRGSVGKVAVVPPEASKGVLHPCIIRFIPNKQLINSKFIEYIFNNSDIVLNQILYKSNSTTIDVIYSYSLREVYLPIIPLSEQKEIIKYLDVKCAKLDAIIIDKKAQLETLAEYKKSLIYEYVTGKKEIPNELD